MHGAGHSAARSAPRGLTLIEMMVAIAVVGVLFSAVVISVGSILGTKAKASAAELGGVIRSLYDTAALSGRTCRLVFELPSKEDDERPVRYRAECAEGAVTMARDRAEELRQASLARDQDERGDEPRPGPRRLDSGPTLDEVMAREQSRVEAQAKFSAYTAPEVEPRELPSGVSVSVWTRQLREPVSQGVAYLYFFPQGFTERAQIYFRQGDNVWTITVSPLTGKTSVVAEELEVPSS